MKHAKHDLAQVVPHFPIEGRFLGAEPYGSGHINDTYVSYWDVGGRKVRSLQQRINHAIFKNPPGVMDNILLVTRHLRRKLEQVPGSEPDRETLTVVPARDGTPYYRDPEGNYWRTYIFIEGAATYDVCQGPAQAAEAARSFGRFQQLLADLPADQLHETIPFFHHTPRRFATLEDAIARDAANRCASVRPEIEFALAHRNLAASVTSLLESGEMPVRVTHNDTKLNNVMLDDRTGRGVCVIDLDTVMKGSVLYDFGDMMRTCTRTSVEDETDLSTVTVDMQVFEAATKGYLETAREFLKPIERDMLALSCRLITFTIGIRFLADYLAGDVYFKTHHPNQNRDRCRVQFRMISEMERLQREMEAIVRKHA